MISGRPTAPRWHLNSYLAGNFGGFGVPDEPRFSDQYAQVRGPEMGVQPHFGPLSFAAFTACTTNEKSPLFPIYALALKVSFDLDSASQHAGASRGI